MTMHIQRPDQAMSVIAAFSEQVVTTEQSPSARLTGRLAALLEERGFRAFSARDASTPDRFIAVLSLSRGLLLVIWAQHGLREGSAPPQPTLMQDGTLSARLLTVLIDELTVRGE